MSAIKDSMPSKSKALETYYRFGLICKGVVYCLIGILTTMAAIGLARKSGKNEVFKTIYDQPFGKVLLIVIAIGLFGYVLLRFLQGIKDTKRKGSDAKGIATRAGYIISAILYSGFALYAAKLVLHNGDSGKGDSKKFIVAKVLDYPGGNYLIGIAAIIIILTAFRQIIKGIKGKFMKDIHLRMANEKLFKRAGMIGYISRGIVILILGYMLLHGAIASNPNDAQDTKGAFDFLEHTFGTLLMGLVSSGLILYGIFMFIKAKHERLL